MTDTPVFDFAAAKNVRDQQANFEAAKAELKTVQKSFLATGAIDAFRTVLKEATGGRAKEYLYLKVVASDGSECCAYIKGNEKVGNNGSVNVTLGYWESGETINLAQILEFYPGEDGAYTKQWQAESDAYDQAEAEEAKRLEEEEKQRIAQKEADKLARQAAKDAAKNGGKAPEADAGSATPLTNAEAPATPKADAKPDAAAPKADAPKDVAPKADAPKADAGKAAAPAPGTLGDKLGAALAEAKPNANGAATEAKPNATDARTAPRGPGAAAPSAPVAPAAKA